MTTNDWSPGASFVPGGTAATTGQPTSSTTTSSSSSGSSSGSGSSSPMTPTTTSPTVNTEGSIAALAAQYGGYANIPQSAYNVVNAQYGTSYSTSVGSSSPMSAPSPTNTQGSIAALATAYGGYGNIPQSEYAKINAQYGTSYSGGTVPTGAYSSTIGRRVYTGATTQEVLANKLDQNTQAKLDISATARRQNLVDINTKISQGQQLNSTDLLMIESKGRGELDLSTRNVQDLRANAAAIAEYNSNVATPKTKTLFTNNESLPYTRGSLPADQFADVKTRTINSTVSAPISIMPFAAFIQQSAGTLVSGTNKLLGQSSIPQNMTEAQRNTDRIINTGSAGYLWGGKQLLIGAGEFLQSAKQGYFKTTIGPAITAESYVADKLRTEQIRNTEISSYKGRGGTISEYKPSFISTLAPTMRSDKTIIQSYTEDKDVQTIGTVASLVGVGKFVRIARPVINWGMKGLTAYTAAKTIENPSQENLRELGPFVVLPIAAKVPGYAKRSVVDTSVEARAKPVEVKPSSRYFQTSETTRNVDIGKAITGADKPAELGFISGAKPSAPVIKYTDTGRVIRQGLTPAQELPVSSSKGITLRGPSSATTEITRTYGETSVKGYTKQYIPPAPKTTVFQIPVPEFNRGDYAYRTGFPVLQVTKTTGGKYYQPVNPFTNEPSLKGISVTSKGVKYGAIEQKGVPLSDVAIQTTPVEKAGELSKLRQVKGLREEEIQAQLLRDEAVRLARGSKGLKVETFILGVEGLKNPEKTSEITARLIKALDARIYGSSILSKSKELPLSVNLAKSGETPGYLKPTAGKPTGLLPEPWTVKPGDVDLMSPSKTTQQIAKTFEPFLKEYAQAGEKFTFKPEENTLYITEGNKKFIETKSGIDQAQLNLGDTAAEGFSGFVIKDSLTTRQGGVKSITPSSQFVRRTAAASLISPGGKGTAEFASFETGGILGKSKPDNMRGSKDVAQYFIEGYGNAQLKIQSSNPLTQREGFKLSEKIGEVYSKYTPEQQADIYFKMIEKRGNEFTIALEGPAKEFKPFEAPKSDFYVSPRQATTPSSLIQPSVSPSGKIISPSIRTSPTTPTRSPNQISSSPTRSISPSLSISSSPYISSSPSISPSPEVSPSPNLYTTSSSPSPSSPSPSISPSPFSPSPSISPSPSSPSPSPSPSFSPSLFSPSPSPKSPEPKPPIIPFLSSRSNIRKKAFAIGVEIRRRGKFKAEKSLFGSLTEAVAFGQRKVRESSAASFKTFAINKAPTARESGKVDLKGLYVKQEKGQNVYVQRTSERISSIGEKREITQKGIAAIRNKNIFNQTFKRKNALY